jgi:arylsulfatase A-like enzyme
MVRSMDDGIGRILSALSAAGLERDTLVVFCSDNGGERFSEMGPFSHGKMSLYEGGIRTPAFARWPGVIGSNTTSDQVAITMDWTATLLARAEAAADRAAPLDGRDLYWRISQRVQQKAMRSGDWKYLVTTDGDRLFDLATDPGETTDLTARRQDVAAQLRDKYAAWEGTVLAPVPLPPGGRKP